MDGSVDIVVVGSCNVDLISYVPRLPVPGETLHGNKFSMGFGGKGANQCVMAARLGAKTAMVAKVGKDTFGSDYIRNLKDNLINVEHVTETDNASTGVAPIAVNEQGENSIIIVSGANNLLSISDVTRADDIIAHAKVVVCQLEISHDTTVEAMRIAKSHDIMTVLNPAPALAALSEDVYKYCDIIVPNETEAEILTGVKVTSSTVEEAVSVLLKKVNTVIITLGQQGAVYATRENRQVTHIPAEGVVAVDTTGAGDSFVGALAYYLACHGALSLTEKIDRSCRIASQSVLKPGLQSHCAPKSSTKQPKVILLYLMELLGICQGFIFLTSLLLRPSRLQYVKIN